MKINHIMAVILMTMAYFVGQQCFSAREILYIGIVAISINCMFLRGVNK